MYESRCKGLLKTKNVYYGRVCAVKVEHWASNVNMCHVICAEASYRFSIILCNLLFLSNYYSWCVSILTSLSVSGLLKHIASKYMNIVEIAPANVSNICSNKNCSYTRVIFSLPHRLPCFIPLFLCSDVKSAFNATSLDNDCWNYSLCVRYVMLF